MADELVSIALTDAERNLLAAGLNEWGGAAHPTDELAIAMGFASVQDLDSDADRLHERAATRASIASDGLEASARGN